MAHYDCGNCGASMSEYPNCCTEEQTGYMKRQVKKWAADTAKRQLHDKHNRELQELIEKILKEQDPHKDKMFVDVYLSKVRNIK